MSWMYDLVILLAAIGLGVPLLLAVGYGVGRAFGVGYFRTKLEYFRTMMKELKRGPNG